MRMPKERKKKRRALTGAACLAVAFSFAFLCACGAEPPAAASPETPSPSRTQTAAPAPSQTVRPSASASRTVSPAGEAEADKWELILVNPSHVLPADFSVELADFEGGQVDARILNACRAMFADAKAAGVDLQLVDAYRSRELQSELFSEKVESYIKKGYGREEAEKEAATITARTDTSEHQTGLALDIVTPSHTSRNSGFADTGAFHWLDENAGSYGFIMRYAKDKTEETGVIYEPWHWRYVGREAAAKIKGSGQCLEEYLAG